MCVRLSCLALGVSSPPEVHAELEKRSALRTLSRTVRETLVSKQYLPLLKEEGRGSWWCSGSVSSWDEPLGFLELKRDVLSDKRSFSDSDLSKITVTEVTNHTVHYQTKLLEMKLLINCCLILLHSLLKNVEPSPYCIPTLGQARHWCVEDLIRPLSPVLLKPPDHQSIQKESHTFNMPTSSMRMSNNSTQRSKCTAKQAPIKYSSVLEVVVIRDVSKASYTEIKS